MTASDNRRIKNEAQYDTLREQGMGKEKAARIANADRPGKTGGKHPAYENWTRKQLYEKARQVGIGGRSKMTKAQLKRALRSG